MALVLVLFSLMIAFQAPMTQVKEIVVADERLEEATHIVVVGDRAAVSTADGSRIYLVSVESGTVVKSIPERRGHGPGELNARIERLYVLHGTLAVATRDQFMHYFTPSGDFITRKALKRTYTDATSYNNTSYAVCVNDFEEKGRFARVALQDETFGQPLKKGSFQPLGVHKNSVLNQCRVSSSKKYLVYGLAGFGTIHFHEIDGSHLRSVDLAVIRDDEIPFTLPASDYGPMAAAFSRVGITDFRPPDAVPVAGVHAGETFTLVTGTFDPPQGRRRHALVRHRDWSVVYFDFPNRYWDYAVANDRLYAMRRTKAGIQVDVYALP